MAQNIGYPCCLQCSENLINERLEVLNHYYTKTFIGKCLFCDEITIVFDGNDLIEHTKKTRKLAPDNNNLPDIFGDPLGSP